MVVISLYFDKPTVEVDSGFGVVVRYISTLFGRAHGGLDFKCLYLFIFNFVRLT